MSRVAELEGVHRGIVSAGPTCLQGGIKELGAPASTPALALAEFFKDLRVPIEGRGL